MATLRDIYGNSGQVTGRPTKYRREYCQQLIDYFLDTTVLHKVVDDPSGRGGTSTHYEVERVPSLFGFAAMIGVNRDTLYEWANAKYPDGHKWAGKKKHPEFSGALSYAQAMEAAIMFEYGATGRLSNALVGLYWTNHLDFKDSKHLDMTSDGERLQTAPAVISVINPRQNDAQTETEASESS